MIRHLFRLSSLVIVAGLVTVLIANSRQALVPTEQLTIHTKLKSITLPPPPPPQQQLVTAQQEPQSPKLDLTVSGEGPSLTLSDVNVALPKPSLKGNEEGLESLVFSFEQGPVDIPSFGLDDLDDLPRLLTPLKIKFTSAMRRSGVKEVAVKLHVVIDEKGVVLLQGIKSNPHPELNSSLRKMVRSARFTSPERFGKKVRAEFIWPLVLKE